MPSTWGARPGRSNMKSGCRGGSCAIKRSPIQPASRPVAAPNPADFKIYDPRTWFASNNPTPPPAPNNPQQPNPNGPAGLTSSPIPDTGQGWFSKIMMGRDPQFLTYSPYSTGQLDAFQQLLNQGLGGLQQQNYSFDPIEQRARMMFQQNTIPSLAERFTQMGGQNSSAFQQQLGLQGSDLESQLAAMKSQYNMGLLPLYQNLANIGLTPRYENIYSGGGEGLLAGASRAAGQLIPLGAKIGAGMLGF